MVKKIWSHHLAPQNPEDEEDAEEDSSVTIAGVPVDPSANYVMITTNVTDPTK